MKLNTPCPAASCKFQMATEYSDELELTPEQIEEQRATIAKTLTAAHNAGKHAIHAVRAFTGQMIHKDAEVIMIFKANGKYYPANDNNREVMDTYLHTGAPIFLDQLTDEVEL